MAVISFPGHCRPGARVNAEVAAARLLDQGGPDAQATALWSIGQALEGNDGDGARYWAEVLGKVRLMLDVDRYAEFLCA
jgi:hypothetical protein